MSKSKRQPDALLCFLLFSAFILLPIIAERREEAEALQYLYGEMGGDKWKSSRGWVRKEEGEGHPCKDGWYGVTCDEYERVIGINLASNRVIGTLNATTLCQLEELRYFSISSQNFNNTDRNYIDGPFPSCLLLLSKFAHLDVAYTGLDGPLPNSLECHQNRLEVIKADNTFFEGSMPQNMSGCTTLRTLVLSSVEWLNGTIPSSIGDAAELEVFDISHTMVEGSIPESISSLASLRVFDTKWTRVNSSLPAGVGTSADEKSALLALRDSLSFTKWEVKEGWDYPLSDPCLARWYGIACTEEMSVTGIDLDRNGLDGRLEDVFRSLPSLSYIRMGRNQISGSLPLSLQYLTSLIELSLPHNMLTGTLPRELFPRGIASTSLEEDDKLLFADDTSMYDGEAEAEAPSSQHIVQSGEFDGLGLQMLEKLDLAYNGLQRMEGALAEFLRLKEVNVRHNQISGEIGLLAKSNECALEVVHLDDNKFTGPFPSSLYLCSHLTALTARRNLFEGSIPTSFSFSLPSSGTTFPEGSSGDEQVEVVSDLSALSQLLMLDFGYNRLSGELPAALFSLPSLQSVYADNNMLESVGQVQQGEVETGREWLSIVNLRGNRLAGNVHDVFQPALFPNLASLDLSSNSLSGSFPSFLLRFKHMRSLGLALNFYSGFVPAEVEERLKEGGSSITLTNNSWNCPVRPRAYSAGARCVTRSCPLNFESTGRGCYPCTPGHVRWQQDGRCVQITEEREKAEYLAGVAQQQLSAGFSSSSSSFGGGISTAVLLSRLASTFDVKGTPPSSTTDLPGVRKYLVYGDGSVYVGDLKWGAPHGRGVMIYAGGTEYRGEFSYGTRKGRGTMRYALPSPSPYSSLREVQITQLFQLFQRSQALDEPLASLRSFDRELNAAIVGVEGMIRRAELQAEVWGANSSTGLVAELFPGLSLAVGRDPSLSFSANASSASELEPYTADGSEEATLTLEVFSPPYLKPTAEYDILSLHSNRLYLASVDVRGTLAVDQPSEFEGVATADKLTGTFRSSRMDAARVNLVEAYRRTQLWFDHFFFSGLRYDFHWPCHGPCDADFVREAGGTVCDGEWGVSDPLRDDRTEGIDQVLGGGRNGYGLCRFADGSIYEGEWVDGKRHGVGVYANVRGDVYAGDWIGHVRDGLGVMEYADTGRYDGEWKDDEMAGQGRYKEESGSEYEGEWKNGKRHGIGIQRESSGAWYNGEWRENNKDGVGESVDSDGNYYRGHFAQGEYEGEGSMIYADGGRYDGEWRGNRRHGRGLYRNAGKKVTIALWRYDVAVKEVKQENQHNELDEAF